MATHTTSTTTTTVDRDLPPSSVDTSHSNHPYNPALYQHRTFVFIKENLSYTVNTPDGQHTLLYIHSERSFWLPGSAKSMTIHRNGPEGEEIGTVKYYGTTSLKADLALHGHSTVKWSGKKMHSATGLGDKLQWGRDEKDRLTTAGSMLKLEDTAAARTLARLATGSAAELGGLVDADVAGGGSGSADQSGGPTVDEEKYWHAVEPMKNAGRFVMSAGTGQQRQQQLSREQFEEIVVTGIVEHEKRIKEKQMLLTHGESGGGGHALSSMATALLPGPR